MNKFAIHSIPGFAEPLSCWSHLIAAGIFALLAISLMRRAVKGSSQPGAAGPVARVAGVGIFCVSVVALLAISGVYHLLDFNSTGRSVLLRVDYAAIFFLIAGTFTPICTILLRGFLRALVLVLIWTIAVTGITLKIVFFTQMAGPVGTVIYIAGGAIQLAGYPTLIPGVVGPHEVFHLAVIFGISFHWKFIARFADGQMPQTTSELRSGKSLTGNPQAS
ncbi:MAG: hemolysin III family protein [Pirellulales bacterium]|nr:hemolysin III family protein [Pirellulales bacterium]